MMAGSVVTVAAGADPVPRAAALLSERAAGRERQGMRRIAILAGLAAAGGRPRALVPAIRWTMPQRGLPRARTVSPRPAAPCGNAVEMAYDFGGVSGYAFVRRKVDIPLPRNYEIRFRMRGTGGPQRFADEAHQWRQCVVEGLAQSPPAGRVAGHRRPGGRNRLRLGSDRGQDPAPCRGTRIRRRPQSRRRRGHAADRRSAHRPAARNADRPAARSRIAATTPSSTHRQSQPRAAPTRAPSSASSPTGRWPARTAARSAR